MKIARFLELLSIYSISGFEQEVRKYSINNIDSKKYKIIKDPKGSVFALKKSQNKNAANVVVAAHFDEVGFLVSRLNENGSISIIPIGNINSKIMLSQELLVLNEKNKLIPGVIGGVVPHLTKNQKNFDYTFEELKLDLGFSSIEDLKKHYIKPGQQVFFPANAKLNYDKSKIFSKSVDNRIGCGIILELIDNFKDANLDFNLYLGFHTQEEVGLRGAKIAGQNIDTSLMIAIDTSPVDDINKESKNKLGKGPMLRLYDPGIIMKTKTSEFFREKLSKYKAKFQEYFGFGGTDATAYNTINKGTTATAFVVPARYIHTSCSVVDINDIEEEIKFLTIFLKNLKTDELNKLNND